MLEKEVLDALQRVADLQYALDTAEMNVEDVRQNRNKAIIEAVSMGVPVQEAASVAMLSRASVYYLLENRKCSVLNCEYKIRAKGLCHKHYTQQLRKA